VAAARRDVVALRALCLHAAHAGVGLRRVQLQQAWREVLRPGAAPSDELVFQLGDPVFVYFPFCLGSLIFRILGKVRIVGNCFLNAQNETRSLDLNATLQLFFKDGVTRGRHGKLVHRSLRPSGLIPVWATY
jgi:hypothetical protein